MATLSDIAQTSKVALVFLRNRAPDTSDDISDGYGVGSLWTNTLTADTYVCISNTAGDALWEEVAEQTQPGELTWPSPTAAGLMGAGGVQVVDFTLNDSTRNSSVLGTGAGRDLRINQTGVLTGPLRELGSDTSPWRHIEWIGGEIASTVLAHGHVIPRDHDGIFHIEGVKYTNSNTGDFLVARKGGPNCIWQIQNVYGEVSHRNTTVHADWFQTQVCRIGSLRLDKCTVVTNYQGLFCNNEPESTAPHPTEPTFKCQIFETRIKRTNFRLFPGSSSLSGTWFFKGIPPRYIGSDTNDVFMGPWTLEDVWSPTEFPGPRHYPHGTFRDWRGADIIYGSFATPTTLRFSTPSDTVPAGAFAGQPAGDCGISGVVNLGDPPGGDFCPASLPGINYVSPGYQ